MCLADALIITRHSLVRAKGEVFGLLYVCLFVCSSTISRQPAGRFTPYFACRRSLGQDVSSPLLGVGGPWRAEKGANEIFVTMGVNREFLHSPENQLTKFHPIPAAYMIKIR